MKYIRFAGGIPEFIFFLAPLMHREVAAAFAGTGRRPQSAGYYDTATGLTFGNSSTLALNPHPDDADLIGALYKSTLALAPKDSLPL